MKVSVQISYYPLGKKDFKKIINEFLKKIGEENVKVDYSTMSTVLYGDKNIIMNIINNLINVYFNKYDSILELKISNTCPKI